MSIGTLITLGYGSFGSAADVILRGYGAFSNPFTPSPNDDDDWAPERRRRVRDSLVDDLRARREALLTEARREIGLLEDDEPPPPVLEEIIEEIAEIEAAVLPPEAPPFDKAAYAAAIARTLRAEILAAEVERAEWIRRDDEAVLLLAAAVA